MKSALPKVLHPLAGRPLVHYPVRAALEAGCARVVVVVGHGRAEVAAYLASAFPERVSTAVQEEQRGTGDAARAGLDAVHADTERVLVFYGDVPLMTAEDVAPVAQKARPAATPPSRWPRASSRTRMATAAFCAARTANVVEIREHKDLKTDPERAVREINPGIFAVSLAPFPRGDRFAATEQRAGEQYYLTDIVAFAVSRGKRVVGVDSRAEVLEGVNDRHQLALAEEAMYARIGEKVAAARRDGSRRGPHRRRCRRSEPEALIEAGAVLRGTTRSNT